MKQTNIYKLVPRLAAIFSFVLIFIACQKELSTEKGAFNGAAEGELIDSLGFCKNIAVNGKYIIDTPLNTSNYVTVNLNFTGPGKYKIYSDTVNGMWFLDSGFVVSAGQTAIKLKGKGTPILDKQTDFVVFFGNNLCSFSINVTNSTGGSGTGGGPTNTDYFPLTAGSYWLYDFIPDVATVDTFTVTVASQQVQVTGDPLIYSQFGTRLKDTFYFSKSSSTGDYYAFSTVDFDYTTIFDEYPTGSSFFFSYIFLKPNALVNDTWETAEYGKVGIKDPSTQVMQRGMSKARFTIVKKNTEQYTIGGKTYDNVINVKREILFKPDGGANFQVIIAGNSYYAKGYGLIDQVIGTGPALSVSLYRTPTIK